VTVRGGRSGTGGTGGPGGTRSGNGGAGGAGGDGVNGSLSVATTLTGFVCNKVKHNGAVFARRKRDINARESVKRPRNAFTRGL
jgi:hypothetical protein